MAESKPQVRNERHLLHPLASLHWKHCHTWRERVIPLYCAVLHNEVLVLDRFDRLHISTDLHSWTSTDAPCDYSSLTTYQSKFVLVGGRNPSTREVSNSLLTSTTGLDWKPSLRAMPTRRCYTSSVSGGSPEVLVVAGGCGSLGEDLDIVEVLLNNHWTTADSLPTPCENMRSAFHEGNFYFTGGGGKEYILFICSLESSRASASNGRTIPLTKWRTVTTPINTYAIASYLSDLIGIDEHSTVSSYFKRTEKWIETTIEGNRLCQKNNSNRWIANAALSTEQLVVANEDGVYKATLSVISYSPNNHFTSNVLSRLEAVMGIDIVSVLANSHSQLTKSTGVELPDLNPQIDPMYYATRLFVTWCELHHPTWQQLLDVLQDIGLTELSQQIDAFMRGFFKYEDAYKHFIVSKDVLEFLSIKFMFLGPPRQGKSTTRRRVMKEIIDLLSSKEDKQIHGSTGTVECCSNMFVQGTSDPTTAERRARWTIVQNLIEEASILFHSLRDSLEIESTSEARAESRRGSATSAEVSQASSTEQSHLVEEPPQPSLLQKMMARLKSFTKGKHPRSKKSSPLSLTPVQLADEEMTSQDYSEIAAIFQKVSKQPQFVENVKHSFRAFLRMEDTGGQPELMDMLPALTIGPGLYLLLFSYEFQLDEEYRVFYQRASGETTAPENSEFTLQEMLLRTLASISCFSSSTHLKPQPGPDDSAIDEILESSKSIVYLVGTHKDMVTEEDIATVDSQLQKVIGNTDFYKNDIVQFCSKDKLVISVDNMGGGVEEIHHLQQLLENAMEKHFKKMKIPAVWLLFSLCLRMRKVRTASLETCLAVSSALNMTPYETDAALWFLHHHAGVLMYFPSLPGLEDLVIIDIQVVYDSITGVILKAMSFDSVGHATAERFRKTGQFTMIDLKKATADISGDLILPEQLVALLAYLHLVAEIVSVESCDASPVLEEQKEYIMPCVLENTSAQELDQFHKESCRSCLVEPLLMYFSSGFTPIGLFPASIACLISNKSFKFIREGVKKNMVHFWYGTKKIRVTFISRCKYFEVIVSCNAKFQDSIHGECTALKQEIEGTLKKASSRMNYSSYMDYQFAFDCRSHEGGNHLGMVDGTDEIPEVMTCPFNLQAVVLANRHLIWYGQKYEKIDPVVEISENDNNFSIFLSVYPDLVHSVTPCVMTVADHCYSIGLISQCTYDQLRERKDLIGKDRARTLLDNIRTVFSSRPSVLKEFVTVLSQTGECNDVADKIQQQLQSVE